MRNKFIFFLMSLIALVACNNQPAGNASGSFQVADSSKDVGTKDSTNQRYELKSGIIYYKPVEFMKGIKSTDILYFDDYGNKESKETITETTIRGVKNTEIKVALMVNGYSTVFVRENIENGKDVAPKQAHRMKLTPEMQAMGQAIGSALTNEMKLQFDYRNEGTEKVAGVEGQKFSMAMGSDKNRDRISGVVYKKIPLKTKVGPITIEAVKIEENTVIPPSKFEVPADYKIIETSMDDVMQGRGMLK